jgi:hypothetical protein
MKIPRDINAADLIRGLKSFGYETTRQEGSDIRLTTTNGGTHHLTIPNHRPLCSVVFSNPLPHTTK